MWPNPPAPVTLSTNHCAQEIVEAIIKALAPACPDARHRGLGAALPHRDPGRESAHERPFIWHLFHARPGGGASLGGRRLGDGGRGAGGGRHQVRQRRGAEVRFPLFFEHHEFRPDSGGDGRYRGGAGSVLELRGGDRRAGASPTPRATASATRRTACSAGEDGLPHRYRLRSRGRRDRVLKTKEVGIPVRPGDVFLVESGGGGGYGDPRQRDAPRPARTTARTAS